MNNSTESQSSTNNATLTLDAESLERLIESVVSKTLARIGNDAMPQLSGRIVSETRAAEYIGISVDLLRDERRAGRIKARQIGKRFRYSEDELRRYLAQ